MNGSALYSDVVLPAATWYEKHDLSRTDLHPFVHSFNQAIPPPWEARTDWDVFGGSRARSPSWPRSTSASRRDLVAAPLLHDTPDELAQPLGEVRDWRAGECEPVPGKTMPKLIVVERDYAAVRREVARARPAGRASSGSTSRASRWKPRARGRRARGATAVNGGAADGRPSLRPRRRRLRGDPRALGRRPTAGSRVEGFRALEERSGVPLADLAEERADERITFDDTQVQPRKVITSPEWSGIESRERRYSPFTINVERDVPWHTLTGRQHLYLDHEWMLELGEGLPAYRPPVDAPAIVGEQLAGDPGARRGHVRYLTPHSKWSIHSEFQDNLHMLTLFRGGPVDVALREDAETIGVADNDWVEVYNRNGVVACRAVVSHRVPEGVCLMYHSKDRHVNVPGPSSRARAAAPTTR